MRRSDVGESTHRYAMRRMRKYQKRLMNWRSKMGAKIWYFIHHTIQTPSGVNQRLDVSLEAQ